nr:MAG TPA: hypothetical protein [Caudoviricetes sp.]
MPGADQEPYLDVAHVRPLPQRLGAADPGELRPWAPDHRLRGVCVAVSVRGGGDPHDLHPLIQLSSIYIHGLASRVRIGHRHRLRPLQLVDPPPESQVVCKRLVGGLSASIFPGVQHHRQNAGVVLRQAGGTGLRLRHARVEHVADGVRMETLQQDQILRRGIVDPAVAQDAGLPVTKRRHPSPLRSAAGLGQVCDDEALVHDQVAAHHGVAQDGDHALHSLDAVIHPHGVVAEQAQLVVGGIAVQHGLDGSAASGGGRQGGQVADDGVGHDVAAVLDGADVGVARGGVDLEHPLLVAVAQLADGLQVRLVQQQPGVLADGLVAAVGEEQVIQQVLIDGGDVHIGGNGSARHVFGVLDAEHVGGSLAVAVDNQGRQLAPHGPHGHVVDLGVVVGGTQPGDVAIHELSHVELVGADLGHAEGGVGAGGAGLAGVGGNLAALGVDLGDHIGLQEAAHAGQVLDVHLIHDGGDHVAQRVPDVAAGAGGLHQSAGGQSDGVHHGPAGLVGSEGHGLAGHEGMAALLGHIAGLCAGGSGSGHDLAVLLGDEVLDVLDAAVEITDIRHGGIVVRLVARIQSRLCGFQTGGALGGQIHQIASEIVHVLLPPFKI